MSDQLRSKQVLYDRDIEFQGGNKKILNLANGVAASDAVNKAQLDAISDLINNFEWQSPAISRLLAPPVGPVTGDRYLIDGVGSGAFAGFDNQIAEWNGSSWDFTDALTGTFIEVIDEPDGLLKRSYYLV